MQLTTSKLQEPYPFGWVDKVLSLWFIGYKFLVRTFNFKLKFNYFLKIKKIFLKNYVLSIILKHKI